MNKKRICMIFIFLSYCAVIMVFPLVSHARATSGTVDGIIENVTDAYIVVRGDYYDYNDPGIKLRNVSEKKASPEDLREGRKVEISFRNGKVDTILIYDIYVVE